MKLLQSTCLYPELDPVSGSIPANKDGFRRLIYDLKSALILHECVIVNTGALTEHPLTLPAFEHLRPFVTSGKLWTSGGATDPAPIEFVGERYQGANFQRKRFDHNRLIARWEAIAPEHWRVKRDVHAQMANATENILANLEIAREKINYESYAFETLVELVGEQNVSQHFDRTKLLAFLGSKRNALQHDFLHQAALLIQAEFMRQGGASSLVD